MGKGGSIRDCDDCAWQVCFKATECLRAYAAERGLEPNEVLDQLPPMRLIRMPAPTATEVEQLRAAINDFHTQPPVFVPMRLADDAFAMTVSGCPLPAEELRDLEQDLAKRPSAPLSPPPAPLDGDVFFGLDSGGPDTMVVLARNLTREELEQLASGLPDDCLILSNTSATHD